MNCIDIEKRFAAYDIGYEDPSFTAQQDPWHKVIKCRHGHICAAGGTRLWACTNGRRNRAATSFRTGEWPPTWKRSPALVPAVIKMDGDDGINAEFDVADWRIIFKLMGAKRA